MAKTTKEICIKCGHVGNVAVGSKLWACGGCGRMQRTAALKAQRAAEHTKWHEKEVKA